MADARVSAGGGAGNGAPAADGQVKAVRKTEKIGEVVSTKMQKTIVVQVSRRVPHPLYKRIVKKHKKFYAHDEKGTAQVGDVVRIAESRPMSKLKRWNLEEVVRRSALVGAAKPSDLDIKI